MQIVAFRGLEQIVPQFQKDFPGGVVIILSNYGICKDTFISKIAAKIGNIGHVKLGEVLVLKKDNGKDKQHFIPLSPDDWMEKLFVYKEHNKLHLDQWTVFKGIDVPEKYKDITNINWLYLTLKDKMRNLNNLKTLGGCGIIHICPDKKCKKFGCYKHLPLNNKNFDCQELEYGWFCSCEFDENDDNKKVGVRSSFQGAIPSYLCCNNSNLRLSKSTLKYLESVIEYAKQFVVIKG